jgi:phosphoribosylaminoimidazolecarboxamide formyltransferase/IMP cyclohydrolase
MKNLRIIDVSPLDTWEKIHSCSFGYNMKWTIGGKPVITGADSTAFFNSKYGMEAISDRKPKAAETTDAHIAWIGAKAVQSNSFAFVKDATLLAQCGGQTNREDSAKFAKIRADEFGVSLEGSAAATDSFLFDHTAIELLHGMGVRTVVHPTRRNLTTGNLKPDQQILAKVNEHDMVMLRPYLVGPDGQEMPWRVFRHL